MPNDKLRSHTTTYLLMAVIALGIGLPAKCEAAQWADTKIAGPFVIRADFSLENYNPLIHQLIQLQDDLIHTLDIPPARERISVYLFHSSYSYRRFLETNFPKVSYRRALYIKTQNNPGIVLAYRSSNLPVDLRHECTHALLHAVLPLVPLWLDEGLAEYFEVPPLDRESKNPHMLGIKWGVQLGFYEELHDLEQLQDFDKMTKSAYRSAWAWIHFILHSPANLRLELTQFLAQIRSNNPPGLLSHRLTHQIPHLDTAFCNHFRNWQ